MTDTALTGPVLRYPGGKWRLARHVLPWLAVPHRVYLEPYFGGGSVFFQKEPSRHEALGDLNGDVVSTFRVMRTHRAELVALIAATPYARGEFEDCFDADGGIARTGDPLEDARRFLIRCWMAHSSTLDGKSGWRHAPQGANNGSVARTWQTLPDRIWAAAERLRDAEIENRPALDLITSRSSSEVLIYADPPYLLDTRNSRAYGPFEMTEADHRALLEVLCAHPGPVVLSGYGHPLYDTRLAEWHRVEVETVADGGAPRVECLWINPVALRGRRAQIPAPTQVPMFGGTS